MKWSRRCFFLACLSGFVSVSPWQSLSSQWQDGVSAILLGIRDIESSEGRDCGPGDAGELSCFQILPATALLERCPSHWKHDEAAAAECAGRWLARGARLCRRWDYYGEARWYHRGRCLPRHARPLGYEMDVARARLKYLM